MKKARSNGMHIGKQPPHVRRFNKSKTYSVEFSWYENLGKREAQVALLNKFKR